MKLHQKTDQKNYKTTKILFQEHLDDLSLRSDWGIDRTTAEERQEVVVPRIETLVAGFTNRCHLRCSFCYEDHFGRNIFTPQDLDMTKLISLIQDHKVRSGENIEYFRIGNTGEPLTSKKLENLLIETQSAVNWYSIISSFSVNNDKLLSLVESHPQVKMLHASCDASDANTYSQFRRNGNFNLVWQNIRRFKKSNKYIVLNAVAFTENKQSLLGLPKIMSSYGVDELHIFYPLNTQKDLSNRSLSRMSLSDFAEFYSNIRNSCIKYGIVLRTDPWCYHPSLVGIIEDIDTPELYSTYQQLPCDWQWTLILHPDGTYHHCSIQNNLGQETPKGSRPFDKASSLFDLVNGPEALAFRRLHLDGRFPLVCQRICHKRNQVRPESTTRLLFSLKYESDGNNLSANQLSSLLKNENRKLTVRAFSPQLRRVVESNPSLAERISIIMDRNPNVTRQFPVIPPGNIDLINKNNALLIGSNLSSVFFHAAALTSQFEHVYKVIITGNKEVPIAFRKLK